MEANCIPGPAQLYEQFYGPAIFRPLAEVLVDFAPPPVGGRVLDLACGTGLVARAVAAQVGPAGSVTAADINPAMLAVARSQPAGAGAAIEWVEADATTADLPAGHFDMVYCQQGLQFFSDRQAALARARSALKRTGRFAVATWEPIEQQPLHAAFAEVELRHLSELGVTYDDLIAPFSLGDRDELRQLLEEAGFQDVEIRRHPLEVRWPEPGTFVRNMETAYGAVLPAFVANAAAFASFLDAVERETRDIVQRYTVDGELRFPMPTNLAVAKAP
jgi:ubiquinone/menaquinone biosynthesis C-methylase UbiE